MAIATDAFLAAFLPSGRSVCTLVKIELTDPSALTLYLSTRETTTPGSPPQFWQGALADVGSVVEPGDLGAYDPGLASFDFILSARPLVGQSVSDFSLEKLASHYWYGATVTAYYWETSLTDFANALQIFKGVVIEFETEANEARIYCQQRNDWIVRVPAEEVTRSKYPRAPEKSIGLPIPICYGDMRTTPTRPPDSGYGAFNQSLVGVFGVRRAGVRGVVVDLGKGDGSDGRVLFAGHACKLFNDDSAGATPCIPVGDRLCEMDPLAGKDFNAAGGTGFDFDDITSADVQPFDVFYPVLPLDSKQSASGQGDNARAATDGFNDTSYVELDYDAGKTEALYPIPDISPQGTYISARDVYGWSTTAGAANLRADFVNVGDGGGHTATLSATADLNTKTGAGTSISSGTPSVRWHFGSSGCYLRVYFTGTATGQKARIYFAGLAIKFRPNWPVVTAASSYEIAKPGVFRPKEEWDNWYTPKPAMRTIEVAPSSRVDAAFFATLQGYADSGGTYTGSGTDLIQRPPDILRHFLTTYCSETLFKTASSDSGDLEDLRDALKTWRASDMVAAFAIDEFKMSSDVVRALARSTMCWFFISCFDDKWHGIPWKAGRSVDFPRRMTRHDLSGESAQAGPKIIMHRDSVMNDLRVTYGHDAWSRRTIHETRVGPNHSNSGHKWRQLRDERITVVASESDRIDFTVGAGSAATASLTAGDYTASSFRQHVSTQMNAVSAQTVFVVHGMLIEENINDSIPINDGASKEAVIAAGNYNGNPTGLATAAQTALNAVSSNWTVTYSATTQKFTIDRSAGTEQVNWATGTGSATTAALSLGFSIADVTASTTSTFAVESDRYVVGIIAATGVITFAWETGTNGIDAATPRAAGALLGFDMARDYVESTSYALAHSPKGVREHDCATSVTRYGARPEVVVDLTEVNDTDTAREVRNRMLDLWKQPPVEIQFETERMPDLQKGMVFDFDASLDEVKPYAVPGSDGSWLGKEFVAVRVERHSLPTSHQSVVAFEVPAS